MSGGDPPARELSRAELDALSTPFRDEFAADVERAGGDASAINQALDRIEREYARFVDGFHAFTAAITEWVLAEHGNGALPALVHAGFEAVVTMGDASPALPDAEPADAMDRFDAMEVRMRRLHDLAHAQVTASLSHVYRTFGVDALEACLRHCGDRTLLGWMPHDVARPAAVRVRQWSRMMRGNFATIRVDETDDAFVITQDPCGTCSRQLLAGAYAPPLDFAVVEEPHPITWGRGHVPVYRTHVAVMHDLMPCERTGTRWPDITCPDGAGVGPCRIVLRKRLRGPAGRDASGGEHSDAS
jgi:hypothetical protein